MDKQDQDQDRSEQLRTIRMCKKIERKTSLAVKRAVCAKKCNPEKLAKAVQEHVIAEGNLKDAQGNKRTRRIKATSVHEVNDTALQFFQSSSRHKKFSNK